MTETDPRAQAQAAEREHAAIVRNSLRRIQLKLLDGYEKIADSVIAQHSPPPARAPAPADVERRTVANVLGLWQFCGRRACTRSRCCKGDPTHCLHTGMTLLPEGGLEKFVAGTRRSKRR